MYSFAMMQQRPERCCTVTLRSTTTVTIECIRGWSYLDSLRIQPSGSFIKLTK